MEIYDIRLAMDKAAEFYESRGYSMESRQMERAEKAVEEAVGLYWTLGDNLAIALKALQDAENWIEAQTEDNPFADETFRHKLNHAQELREKALTEWDAQKPVASQMEREFAEALEDVLDGKDTFARVQARATLAKYKEANK